MRIGSLCSGYGGLEIAALSVLDASVAWHVEYDPNASKILAHHWPDVPNHHDLTTVDWAQVEPVDVLTAGYPCQPFSLAGHRKGTEDVRHLWPYVIGAIRHLRPKLVLLENVASHLSLGFDVVLGDLAAAGFDAEWVVLRAADVEAPHGRARLFVAAYPRDGARDGERPRPQTRAGGVAAYPKSLRHERAGGPRGRGGGPADDRLTAPDADRDGLTLERRKQHIGRDADRCGDPHADGNQAQCAIGWDWGIYAAAVRRWHDLTRCVPAPVQPSTRGGRDQLSPAFVEWMQGLPAGHVTDPAIWAGMKAPAARNAQLTALGNGVVWQQAAAAYGLLLPAFLEVAA